MVKDFSEKLKQAPTVAIDTHFFRSIERTHENDLLKATYSHDQGGRYNRPSSFGAIYLADSAENSIRETIRPGFQIVPRILATINVKLVSVIDLESKGVLELLQIESNRLFESWRANPQAYTHKLGGAIYDSERFEGIRYPSEKVRNPQAYNLAVFPARLKKGSFLELHDPSGTLTQRISGK